MPFLSYRIFGWAPTRIEPEWGLRDLPSGMACSIAKTMLCEDCGMLFLDMRFDDEEMAALYDDYRGEAYASQRESFEPGYTARNEKLLDGSKYLAAVEGFLSPYVSGRPSILDWGGDNGVNTPFRASASRHHIFDISNRPPLDGARHVTRDEIKANSYDIVVCANVLEHVPHPRALAKELASVMGPETTLYLEVPHEEVVRRFDDKEERLAHKRHWHEHINFFTQAALDAMLADAGLRVLDGVSLPITAGGKDSVVFSLAARRA
jgi:hypothetical protein